MTAGLDSARAEAVREPYRRTLGSVPVRIEERPTVAAVTGRLDAVEELRRALLRDNPLEPRVHQLVHFAQLVALGHAGPARLHAQGAVRAGASVADLVGVAETSLVTAGMPTYSLAVSIVVELDEQDSAVLTGP